MAEGLTARQTQILKTLIDEYIETATPIGSESLEKKYSLGISPATIRNEMLALTKLGYLRQLHTSSGRVPTPTAMKFYIDQLMEERQMSLADEVKTKEEVLDAKSDTNALLREAAHALAERTRSLAVAAKEGGRVWHSGYKNVFLNPEFTDLERSMSIFSLLEEARRMHELFFERMTGASPVEVLFGEELDWAGFNQVGIAATRFSVAGEECALGVLGPTRLSYPTIIPILRYFRNLIQEVAGE